jgi:hypothetical protein
MDHMEFAVEEALKGLARLSFVCAGERQYLKT